MAAIKVGIISKIIANNETHTRSINATTLYPVISLKKKQTKATKTIEITLKAYCCNRGIWSKRVDNFSIYFS